MNLSGYEVSVSQLKHWIDANLNQFSHRQGTGLEECMLLLKPLGELVLCCDVMIRNHLLVESAKGMMVWAWDELEKGEFLRRALLSKPDMVMVTSIYATFHTHGFSNPGLLNLIKKNAFVAFTRSLQYRYWRKLDLDLACYKLGILSQFNPQIERTWAFHQPDPATLDDSAAYALTHEIFYITHFGESSQSMEPQTAEYIQRWLPIWQKRFLQEDNLDIFTELLMVKLCLAPFSHSEADLTVLTDEVQKYGYLRGPAHGGKNLTLGKVSPARKEFLQHYHTTIVGMIAFALIHCRTQHSNA